MKLLKIGLAVCAFALIVGSPTPVEAGVDGACLRVFPQDEVAVCWDDTSRSFCAETLGGNYQGDGTTCAQGGDADGACVRDGETPECCLIVGETAEEFCEEGQGGDFHGGQTCEEVPVELQMFDVEKK